MIERKQCLRHDELAEYLYGEVDAAARCRIEGHVRACSSCAEEIQSLKQVRGTLASWVPPEVALGFRMVSEEDATVASAPGIVGWWRPALGFALVVVMVLGIVAVLTKPQIELGPDSMVVRIAWGDSATGGALLEEGADPRRSDFSAMGGFVRPNSETVGDRLSNKPPVDIHLVPVDVVGELDRVRQVEQRLEARRQADLSEMERTFEEVDPEDAALASQQLLEYMRRISR